MLKCSLLIISFLVLASCKNNDDISSSILEKNIKSFEDDVSIEKEYLANNFFFATKYNGHKSNFIDSPCYRMIDLENKLKTSFRNVQKKGVKNLFIRYTTIGCNACIDSVNIFLKKNTELINESNIIYLVDFDDFDSYIKWKKVLEINQQVYWVKKGCLPFEIENKNYSYIFSMDFNGVVNDIFIPSSYFSKYTNIYLKHILLEPTLLNDYP